MDQKLLYIFTLVLSAGLLIAAVGGGLFGQTEPRFLQWQQLFFSGLCHQQPHRSFWVNGQPMAVCSRCFGIYSGFFIGLLAGPFLDKMIPKSFLKKLLLVTVILNIVDVVGNIAGLWSNTLLSRLALGFLMAISAGLLLGRAFIKQKNITLNKKSYGPNRTV